MSFLKTGLCHFHIYLLQFFCYNMYFCRLSRLDVGQSANKVILAFTFATTFSQSQTLSRIASLSKNYMISWNVGRKR